MPNILKPNGSTKVTLTIATIVALGGLIFAAGINWAKVGGHVANGEIHQTTEEKQEMMDKRVELLLFDKLDAISKRLDDMERNQRLLMRDKNK